MKITVLTMFPDMLSGLLNSPLVQRAIKQKTVQLDVVDIKDFADGSFRHIDDSPYGGSDGMIIRIEPLVKALESVKTSASHTVLLSPKGKVYNQAKAKDFCKKEHLILVCGHYEGIDARFDTYTDEIISMGDYILTGGEYAAASICDSVIRLLNGVLKDGVTEDESHENNLLEYPQYTHPLEFRGQKVPEILLSGNKREINLWKHRMAIDETKKYRKDMVNSYMVRHIEKSEEALSCTLSETKKTSENIVKYYDNSLPDMHDHNYYRYSKALAEEEIESCINERKSEKSGFIKFQGREPLSQTLIEKYRLEENIILTMALPDTEKHKDWIINHDIQIKDYLSSRNGRDFINLELLNYGSVYGEDFTLRKVSRYLKVCDRNKGLNFAGAYIDSKIISSLFVWLNSDCVGIDGLVTAESFRHRKAATTLLNWACSLAPFAYIHAEENETSKQMYNDLGFREIYKTWEYLREL